MLPNTTKPASGRAGRHQQAREATRRAILDAALELFTADGYSQVSIRNIAAKVEYSPAAIYSYFASKDAIFLALAEEGFRLLDAAHFTVPTGDALDELRAMAWQLYQFSRQQPQYFALVFLDRNVPRIGKESQQFAFIADMRERVLAKVQRCIDEQLFPASVRADVAMRLLWAPIIGITTFQLSNRMPPDVDADALVRDAIDTTIAGLQAGVARHSTSSLVTV
jgi:AcrR family transcriptional regulator